MQQGVYGTWVTVLRHWSDDPSIDLSSLPVLTEESLPPATFERLLKHITQAIEKVMKRWQTDLERDLSNATTEYELSHALVRSRDLLARRMQLSNHPSLPKAVREALMKSARTDITSMQDQIEKAYSRSESRTVIERNDLLHVVKTTPFTAVLADDYATHQRVHAVVDAADDFNRQLATPEEPTESDKQQPAVHRGFFTRLFGKN